MSRVLEGRETLYDGFYRLDRLVQRHEEAGDIPLEIEMPMEGKTT